MDETICKSYFKDGETTTVQAYTDAWIRLINELERSKMISFGTR